MTAIKTIECKDWTKKYTMGGFLPSRIEDLANEIVCDLSCFPSDWDKIESCMVTMVRQDIFDIKIVGKDGYVLPDFMMNSIVHHLANNFFDVSLISPCTLTAIDVLDEWSFQNLMNQNVIICTNEGICETKLSEAISTFGIKQMGTPDDSRRFARCPRLNGLIGPMFPNDGFVARYETQSVYNAMSV